KFVGPLGEELVNSGRLANSNLQVCLLGVGECLLDDVELIALGGTNLISNPGFESDLTGWVVQGSHDQSTIENVGYTGSKSLHIRAGSRGDPGANRVRTVTINYSAVSGTITIRGKGRWLKGWPEILLRLYGGGAECFGKL